MYHTWWVLHDAGHDNDWHFHFTCNALRGYTGSSNTIRISHLSTLSKVLDTDDKEEDQQDKFRQQLMFWVVQTKLHQGAKLHDKSNIFRKQ